MKVRIKQVATRGITMLTVALLSLIAGLTLNGGTVSTSASDSRSVVLESVAQAVETAAKSVADPAPLKRVDCKVDGESVLCIGNGRYQNPTGDVLDVYDGFKNGGGELLDRLQPGDVLTTAETNQPFELLFTYAAGSDVLYGLPLTSNVRQFEGKLNLEKTDGGNRFVATALNGPRSSVNSALTVRINPEGANNTTVIQKPVDAGDTVSIDRVLPKGAEVKATMRAPQDGTPVPSQSIG